MLLIRCPYCGPRPEIEFRGGGEAHIARPADPSTLDDTQWAEFLFFRTNPKGLHAERWRLASRSPTAAASRVPNERIPAAARRTD
jgi:sarcosine oxidase subunit delta